eukprot:g4125.t1
MDMILALKPQVRSILLKNYDYLLSPDNEQLDALGLREKLNEVLEQEGLTQVFIATDAQDDLRSALQKEVKGTVVFYDTAHGAIQFDHKGKQAEALKCGAQRSDAELGSTFFCGLSLQSESEDDQKGFQHEILLTYLENTMTLHQGVITCLVWRRFHCSKSVPIMAKEPDQRAVAKSRQRSMTPMKLRSCTMHRH